MRPPPGDEKLLDDVPNFDDRVLAPEGQSSKTLTQNPAPVALARRPGWIEVRPATSNECLLIPIRMDRQEQLTADILGLIANLERKLDCYSAVQSGRPLEETSRHLDDSAIMWMRATLEDLVATVVGIECHGLAVSALLAPESE